MSNPIDRFLFGAESPRRLAGMRIGLFGLLAFRLAINDYSSVGSQPKELFDPVSFYHLLGQMPSTGLLEAAQVAGVIAALAAMLGIFPRLSFPLAVGLSIFLNLSLNTTGKIIHNDVLLTLCLLPLLIAPRAAVQAWAVDFTGRFRKPDAEESPAFGWQIRSAMAIIALFYFVVGVQKMRYSGLDWVTSDNLKWVLLAASDNRDTPNQLGLFIAERPLLVFLMAAGTIVVEIGFPACLIWKRLQWFFVPAIVGLHAGIYLTMDLNYSAQVLTVIIVFVNWAWIADGGLRQAFKQANQFRLQPHRRPSSG